MWYNARMNFKTERKAKMKMTKILAMAAVAGATALTAAEKPTVEIVSGRTRANDPTVMEVEYCVHAATNRVDVRALGFKGGTRSFANVVQVESFLDGSEIGDNVAANTTNSFTCKVSSDRETSLANVVIDVFAKNAGDGLIPLDLVKIPANGEFGEVVVSTNIVTDAEYLDALYWLYADKDKDLSLKDGWLRDANGTILVNGTKSELQDNGYAAEFVLGKMGYDAMGTNCKWPHALVAAVSRISCAKMPYGLSYCYKVYSSQYSYSWVYATNHRYAIKGLTAPSTKTMGNGLYMVVDLNSDSLDLPVTYLDTAPSGGWSDEYKTNKLVLRRIDSTNGVYYAGVFPVTQAQWKNVMGTKRSYYKGETRPVECVSWNDIRGNSSTYNWATSNDVAQNSFMGALRLMTGLQTFDLPSETEWEFAARAGATTKWLCGDTEDGLGDYAWYSANSGRVTHEVGLKKANAWGLYDVHGNVWEWCLNWYSPGHKGFDRMVIRGGSCYTVASVCALAFRYGYYPSSGDDCFGFRLFCRSESN